MAVASNAPDDLVNVAAATGGGGPPEKVVTEDPTNITGPITDTRVEITKTARTVYVLAGNLVHYRIAVHAPGPSAVFDAVVCDRIPPYTSFVAAPGGTYRHGQVCWWIPYLAVGHTERFYGHGARPAHRTTGRHRQHGHGDLAQRPPAHATVKVRILTRHKLAGGVTG